MPELVALPLPTPPADTPAPRGPLDPITRPLWRMPRPNRIRIMEPFIDQDIQLERWYSRVAAGGDITYKGTLVAIATSTIGSAADLLIIKTIEGNVWAVSTAQVAHVMLLPRPRKAATR